MDISVVGQGVDFALALLLGACLGAVYDFMRIIRGRARLFIVTAVLDVLFWAVCAAAAFWFAMGLGGGELRLFSIIGMVAGAVLYFMLLSMFVRAAGFILMDGLIALAELLAAPVAFAAGIIKNIYKKIKNIFSFAEKKNRIKETARDMSRTARLGDKREKEYRRAPEETPPDYQTRHGYFRGVRGDNLADPSGQNQRHEGGKRRQGGGAYPPARDKRGAGGGYSI